MAVTCHITVIEFLMKSRKITNTQYIPHPIPSISSKIRPHPHARAPLLHIPQMRTTPPKKTLPNKRFTKQQLDILLSPLLRRQRLQKHHYFLEIHFPQLVAPFNEEGGADVEVEG